MFKLVSTNLRTNCTFTSKSVSTSSHTNILQVAKLHVRQFLISDFTTLVWHYITTNNLTSDFLQIWLVHIIFVTFVFWRRTFIKLRSRFLCLEDDSRVKYTIYVSKNTIFACKNEKVWAAQPDHSRKERKRRFGHDEFTGHLEHKAVRIFSNYFAFCHRYYKNSCSLSSF